MSPPNLRDLIGDIRQAVERYSREQLVEVLVYVFKQYVVEGPAPLAAAPAQLADDLAGMSFAEVMRSLQLRLDLPELELFEVQGERVYVRAGGRSVAIEAASARPEPGPVVPAPVTAPVMVPAPMTAPVPASPAQAVAVATAAPRPVAAPAPSAKPAESAPAPAAGGGSRLLEID